MRVSSHDMRLVQELFPRTIVMDDGKIMADGLTRAILEDEELSNALGLEKPWVFDNDDTVNKKSRDVEQYLWLAVFGNYSLGTVVQ